MDLFSSHQQNSVTEWGEEWGRRDGVVISMDPFLYEN